jgi:hypothetical protein
MSYGIGMGNVQAWDVILAQFWKLGQAFHVETNEPVWKYLTWQIQTIRKSKNLPWTIHSLRKLTTILFWILFF